MCGVCVCVLRERIYDTQVKLRCKFECVWLNVLTSCILWWGMESPKEVERRPKRIRNVLSNSSCEGCT